MPQPLPQNDCAYITLVYYCIHTLSNCESLLKMRESRRPGLLSIASDGTKKYEDSAFGSVSFLHLARNIYLESKILKLLITISDDSISHPNKH
jgi:hypothetical protein